MQRFFNTAGPNQADQSYTLPPLTRFDLDEVLLLIEQRRYFVLHAPRQTGKTTALLALQDYLNKDGRYICLYANIEAAQAARHNVQDAIRTITTTIASRAAYTLKEDFLRETLNQLRVTSNFQSELAELLQAWSEYASKPIVLLLDEVDALVGDALISVLRQLRSGYDKRPAGFPTTVVLCGVRDVRDYRIHTSDKEIITGGSAFNIKAVSLRLGDFSHEQMEALYAQHTTETGQIFTPEALDHAWQLTQGQPWLVNALAQQACFTDKSGRDRSQPITVQRLEAAKEALILRRDTHLDQLSDKLREPRVRHIIEPLLAGLALDNVPDDDIRYVIDLGLIRQDGPHGLRIANAIYKEIIPRELTFVTQSSLPALKPAWLTPTGDLDALKLLDSFLAFWRQHGQPLLKSAPYHEIAPHIVLMAFLHRVANGEGQIEREYAIGSRRMDLLLRYRTQRFAFELKVWRDDEPDPLIEGLEQLDDYLSGLGLDTGWLVIFDRRAGLPPIAARTSASQTRTPLGRSVALIRA